MDYKTRRYTDRKLTCPIDGSWSMSTRGHDDLCFASNFGWYGSNMRIFPHRLKNNAIAPTHRISTKITIKASSGLTIIFGSVGKKNISLKVYVVVCVEW